MTNFQYSTLLIRNIGTTYEVSRPSQSELTPVPRFIALREMFKFSKDCSSTVLELKDNLTIPKLGEHIKLQDTINASVEDLECVDTEDLGQVENERNMGLENAVYESDSTLEKAKDVT